MEKKRFPIFWVLLIIFLSAHESFAERCAVFFFEYEHKDSNAPSTEELNAMEVSKRYLSSAYTKLVFLVNTDATKDNLMESLQDALNEYTTVDVYIQAHGGRQFFRGHFDDIIYVHDILSFESFENSERLRLVYIGSCYGWTITDEFLEAGALTGIGSTTKMINFPFYPLFIYNFGQLNLTVGEAAAIATSAPGDNFEVNGDATFRMNSHD